LESDPVAAGFIVSYARPGGNITGMFLDFPDFSKKWLESLKEAVPKATTVAVIWDPATGQTQLRAIETIAPTLGFKLVRLEVEKLADFEPAFQLAKQQGSDVLVVLSSPLIGGNTKALAELATKHRLPAMTLYPDFARDGGLMAYGPNLLTFLRQQGVMAAKILQGARPAELPIETPTRFEFVLNLKTAAMLDIVVPPSILLRADEVIE
jgi:putative ABC transport system substrate-binding protein